MFVPHVLRIEDIDADEIDALLRPSHDDEAFDPPSGQLWLCVEPPFEAAETHRITQCAHRAAKLLGCQFRVVSLSTVREFAAEDLPAAVVMVIFDDEQLRTIAAACPVPILNGGSRHARPIDELADRLEHAEVAASVSDSRFEEGPRTRLFHHAQAFATVVARLVSYRSPGASSQPVKAPTPGERLAAEPSRMPRGQA